MRSVSEYPPNNSLQQSLPDSVLVSDEQASLQASLPAHYYYPSMLPLAPTHVTVKVGWLGRGLVTRMLGYICKGCGL